MADHAVFTESLDAFIAHFADHPEIFLSRLDADAISKITSTTKSLFDYGKKHEKKPFGPLPELLVDGFDLDQIWEEIQLYNSPLVKFAQSRLKTLTKRPQDVNVISLASDTAPPKKRRKVNGSAVDGKDNNDIDENGFGDAKLVRNKDRRVEEEAEEDDDSDDDDLDESGNLEEDDMDELEEEVLKKRRKEGAEDMFDLDQMEEFVNDAEEEEERKMAKGEGEDDGDEEDDDEENEDGDEEENEEEGDEEEGEDDELQLFGDLASDGENDGERDGGSTRKRIIKKTKKADKLRYEGFFDPPTKEKRKHDEEEIIEEEIDEEEEEEREDEEDGAGGQRRKRKSGEGKEEEVKENNQKLLEKADKKKEKQEERQPGESQTAFEKRMSRLRSMISDIEDANVAPKPWQLSGEVSAKDRPMNSLLEEVLEFDHATKPVPIITQETTNELEEVIKRRIADGAFDDVIRKAVTEISAPKQPIELNTEQSKAGLGEIYEQEFLSAAGVKGNDELAKRKQEISGLFKSLCYKLDSLSNFHYTPKPIIKEMEITVNAPAISMEEAIPTAVSDATLLAPEEVYQKPKREVKSGTEITSEERKRNRANKKRGRKVEKRKEEADRKIVEKLNPGQGNPYAKQKALEELKKAGAGGKQKVVTGKEASPDQTKRYFKSSAFFQNLQEEQSKGGPAQTAKDMRSAAKAASIVPGSFLKL